MCRCVAVVLLLHLKYLRQISQLSIKIYKNLPVVLVFILQMNKNYKHLIRKEKRLQPYSKSKLGLESNLSEILSVNYKVISCSILT